MSEQNSLASALSKLKLRAQRLQFCPDMGNLELPVDASLLVIAVPGPGFNFSTQRHDREEAAVLETLTVQRT